MLNISVVIFYHNFGLISTGSEDKTKGTNWPLSTTPLSADASSPENPNDIRINFYRRRLVFGKRLTLRRKLCSAGRWWIGSRQTASDHQSQSETECYQVVRRRVMGISFVQLNRPNTTEETVAVDSVYCLSQSRNLQKTCILLHEVA